MPSVNILTLQLYTWSKLKKENKEVNYEELEKKSLAQKGRDPQQKVQINFPQISLSAGDLKCFSKLAAEEILRRGIERDAKAYTKEQILDILLPEWKEIRQKYKT